MNKLPVLSGKECIQILKKHGFEFRRQKGNIIKLADCKSHNTFLFLTLSEDIRVLRGS